MITGLSALAASHSPTSVMPLHTYDGAVTWIQSLQSIWVLQGFLFSNMIALFDIYGGDRAGLTKSP